MLSLFEDTTSFHANSPINEDLSNLEARVGAWALGIVTMEGLLICSSLILQHLRP